jgi:hypothetical protein
MILKFRDVVVNFKLILKFITLEQQLRYKDIKFKF